MGQWYVVFGDEGDEELQHAGPFERGSDALLAAFEQAGQEHEVVAILPEAMYKALVWGMQWHGRCATPPEGGAS
jgi:hypothetical protein